MRLHTLEVWTYTHYFRKHKAPNLLSHTINYETINEAWQLSSVDYAAA